MKSEFEGAIAVLKEMFEKTDVMYNAIKVDQFDVFEQNLDQREKMMLKYFELRKMLSDQERDANEIEMHIHKIIELDSKIKKEVIRFQEKIETEHLENQKKINQMTHNKKKTNQYQLISETNLRGNIFDRQK